VEKALYIKSITQLKSHSILRTFNRLYLGSEFCTHFLPDQSSLERCFSICDKYQLTLSLILPLYTQEESNFLRATMKQISQWRTDTEMIINDLGHLWLLQNEFPYFPRVWGRVLTKLKADDRLKHVSKKEYQLVSTDQQYTADFLQENQIRRIELSNIAQGIQRDAAIAILPASLYLPYVYLATSHSCLSRISENLTSNRVHASSFTAHECTAPCENFHIRIFPGRLFSGNSIFYTNNRLPLNMETIKINRIVTEKLVFEEIT